MTIPLCGLVLLLGQVQESPPPTYSIAWRPKVGHVVEYQIRSKVDIEGHLIQESAKLHGLVRSSSVVTGYALKTELREHSVSGEGGDITVPDAKDIWLESESEADPDVEELGGLSYAVEFLATKFAEKPVKIGQEWEMKSEEDDDEHYKAVALETLNGKKTLKVTATMTSKDSSSESTYWFRVDDGAMVRAEVHSKGTVEDPSGGKHSEDGNLTVEMYFESDEAIAAPSDEELKLKQKVADELKKLPLKINEAQADLGNYDVSYEEDRKTRYVVLLPKSLDAVKSETYPNGPTIRYRFKKEDSALESASIEEEVDSKKKDG
ncbi:hypothetical protein [Fimbriimonas ginsengisoli]|uniref:Uncharacterized protein n=1 Tax=Fimbriimonas ginsengisoli Gsoil 348 TaxID=661478 RepID=A0A068NTZ0_FIMGI|nr:hypothetical protein [Fimbriimonas ginsengisoli]AIE86911.1 hypothetical protein OP10G_3543 [Fimbriimonas ginsengisoli Gsoil 348]